MTTHKMPQFLTLSRQETPSRQDLHEDCIETRFVTKSLTYDLLNVQN